MLPTTRTLLITMLISVSTSILRQITILPTINKLQIIAATKPSPSISFHRNSTMLQAKPNISKLKATSLKILLTIKISIIYRKSRSDPTILAIILIIVFQILLQHYIIIINMKSKVLQAKALLESFTLGKCVQLVKKSH